MASDTTEKSFIAPGNDKPFFDLPPKLFDLPRSELEDLHLPLTTQLEESRSRAENVCFTVSAPSARPPDMPLPQYLTALRGMVIRANRLHDMAQQLAMCAQLVRPLMSCYEGDLFMRNYLDLTERTFGVVTVFSMLARDGSGEVLSKAEEKELVLFTKKMETDRVEHMRHLGLREMDMAAIDGRKGTWVLQEDGSLIAKLKPENGGAGEGGVGIDGDGEGEGGQGREGEGGEDEEGEGGEDGEGEGGEDGEGNDGEGNGGEGGDEERETQGDSAEGSNGKGQEGEAMEDSTELVQCVEVAGQDGMARGGNNGNGGNGISCKHM